MWSNTPKTLVQLVQRGEEALQRLGAALGVLAHPPVSKAFEHSDLRPRAFSRTASFCLAAGVVVFGGDDDESRAGLRLAQAFTPLRNRGLRRRSVEREDAAAHVF